MGRTELLQRIEQYRTTYLGEMAGRKLLQQQLDEHAVIQAAYQNIQQARTQGQDVTDRTLLTLLPHQDTQYNRERGAHISAWPCITKDVVQWFEGAKWKQPGDWHDSALWILEIVEAGRVEEWATWNHLANQPMQKGFGCGFITPIVHCLNNSLPVVNSKVVKTYAEVVAELGVGDEISASLLDYQENAQRVVRLVEQLKPLGLGNLTEWDIYCHWNISKRLGGRQTASVVVPPAEKESRVAEPTKPVETVPGTDDAEAICQELLAAQFDADHPARFEIAIASAFAALGFQAEQVGGAGNADVVASAALGDESFRLIADAKAKAKLDARFNAPQGYSQIRQHQEMNEANCAVVIGHDFAGGNTEEFARKDGICLMRTDELVELVRANARYGLSLYFIKSLLYHKGGRVQLSLEHELAPMYDRFKVLVQTLEAFETLQRDTEDEEVLNLSEEMLYAVLRSQRKSISRQHLHEAISFLASPILGILRVREGGYVLDLPAAMAANRIQAVANALSGAFSKEA